MFIERIEHLLNRGLPQSPRARELVRELAGRRLAVDMPGVARVLVESSGDALRLRASDEPAEAEIRGGPLSLLALATGDPQELIRRGDVAMTGDTDLAQSYREIARLLRPDVEEELARVVGDTAAHQLVRFARGALSWGRQAADTTARNAAEYLAHERRDLVPRAEADQFLQGVDRLREQVDRLEARVLELERRS